MSDNAKAVVAWPWNYGDLHSIFCKFSANSNRLFVLLEPHSSFRFQFQLLTVSTCLEIAVYYSNSCKVLLLSLLLLLLFNITTTAVIIITIIIVVITRIPVF